MRKAITIWPALFIGGILSTAVIVAAGSTAFDDKKKAAMEAKAEETAVFTAQPPEMKQRPSQIDPSEPLSVAEPAVRPSTPPRSKPIAPRSSPAPARSEPPAQRAEPQREAAPTKELLVYSASANSHQPQPRSMLEQMTADQAASSQQMADAMTAYIKNMSAPTQAKPTVSQNQDFLADASTQEDDFYLNTSLQAPRSPYELKTGTFIPALLITAINSDLPGYITAQVSAPVYDTVSGNYLLIPQGSKLFGTFNSAVMMGQKRVLAVWNRLTLPNGHSISLGAMSGTDGSGASGFADLYEDKFLEAIGAAFLVSVISGVSSTAATSFTKDLEKNGYGKLSVLNQNTSENFAQQLASISAQAIRQSLSLSPTIKIRTGYRFNVFVSKDFILKPYED